MILLGIFSLPITFYIFDKAYEKGYSVSKILGLVLWGFIYWIGNLSKLIENNRSGAVCSLLILIGISAFFLSRQKATDVLRWVKLNKKVCISIEIVFFLFLIFWAFVRSFNPEILGTEKPMELAFINAINRSPIFPPNDPWLSGYSISYYYFGYILVVLFIKILGTSAGIAFNLAIAVWIAMAASASYGVMLNAMQNYFRPDHSNTHQKIPNRLLMFSILAPLLIIFLSNAEGFLEILHSKGFLWEETENGYLESEFWQNLDIKELTNPPPKPFDWNVNRPGGIWWWRASRVLQDYTIDNQSREIIDEFPFFSFYLGDLHPHVLAIPFTLLCIYFGLQFANHPDCIIKQKNDFRELIKNPKYWLLVMSLGSIIFLNIWDFPICFFIVIGAELIAASQKMDSLRNIALYIIQFSIILGLSCLVLFLPFLISFSSQAGGLLPSLNFHTRTSHFLIMFFPQLLIIISFFGFFMISATTSKKILKYIGIVLVFSILFFSLSFLYVLFLENIPEIISSFLNEGMGSVADTITKPFLSIYGASNSSELFHTTLYRRLQDPWLIIILILILGFSLYLMFNDWKKGQEPSNNQATFKFIFLLIILATLLCFFPEFFYLRDQFGWRMNTIFKFYYQAWILFGIASSFLVLYVSQLKGWRSSIFLVLSGLGLTVGMIYPYLALSEKISNMIPKKLSLDGYQYYKNAISTEYEAVEFLEKMPYGVVSEAIGGSYSGYGRISMLTGFPTILGWTGHELQWRGGVKEMGNRENDIRELYQTDDWEIASSIIDRYRIKYIYIGDIERRTYSINHGKFEDHLIHIFNNEQIEILSTGEIE